MNKITYLGDNQKTDFVFSFNFFQKSDIQVEINRIPQTSGYTLTCVESTKPADIPYVGGTIAFDIAPKSTDAITIYRRLKLTRVIDHQPTAKLDPETLNQDADYLMEVIKDCKDEIDELHDQYSDIADKESTSVLLARIEALNQQITNLERDIQDSNVMTKNDFFAHTTNCITSIPQDIKVELSNGILTLKAGSKLYIPNGIGKFKTIILPTDKTATQSANDSRLYFYNGSYIEKFPMSQCYSGDTEPIGQTYMFWYDTVNNMVKITTDGGTTWTSGWSLPFCIAAAQNGALSSIEQLFNGFGYIGSTLFALPGVSGLIPNGRNDNGTLKNYSFETQSVIITTIGANVSIGLRGNAIGVTSTYRYDSVFNQNLSNGEFWNVCIIGSVDNDGVISLKKVLSVQ